MLERADNPTATRLAVGCGVATVVAGGLLTCRGPVRLALLDSLLQVSGNIGRKPLVNRRFQFVYPHEAVLGFQRLTIHDTLTDEQLDQGPNLDMAGDRMAGNGYHHPGYRTEVREFAVRL